MEATSDPARHTSIWANLTLGARARFLPSWLRLSMGAVRDLSPALLVYIKRVTAVAYPPPTLC